MPSPEFWQALLTAECPASKSRALIRELDSLSASEALRRLSAHPALTDGECRRLSIVYPGRLEAALASGVTVLTEADYPEPLGEALGTPPAIFVDGDVDCLRAPTVGIVGTRSATTYGKACAQKFAEAFARAGVTVVSGGALGIDAAAHRGALEAGGRTVAVLASGVDFVYPSVHRELFRRIRGQGCLVSQFPVGSRPNEVRFLIRNSLVAALSRALLVVEAPRRSGALATAAAANELGREVFVVPANVGSMSFQGSFGLLRDGATFVTHPDELLEAIGVAPGRPVEAPRAPLGAVSDRILAELTVTPMAAELIVERTGFDTAEVLTELTMLELDGRIVRDHGGYAVRP